MPKATSVRKCELENPTDLRGRQLALMKRLEPDFDEGELVCRKLRDIEMRELGKKLDKGLEAGGISCYIEEDTTQINFRDCRLMDWYIKEYGYNVSPYMYSGGRRGRYLGWYDWVHFNNTINNVFDEENISANVRSLGGKFKIRKGLDRMNEEDWDELKHDNVGSMMYPIYREDAWDTEGRGRHGFWDDVRMK